MQLVAKLKKRLNAIKTIFLWKNITKIKLTIRKKAIIIFWSLKLKLYNETQYWLYFIKFYFDFLILDLTFLTILPIYMEDIIYSL